MDSKEWRVVGKQVVDYVADYLDNIRDRRVFPDKKPGYLHDELPEAAPVEGESWASIFADVERVIMPGVTHWQSPHMHGYFPALTSYPSMLGEMISNAINCIGFTWASSPALTELEMVVTNWLGKMIGLPEQFLFSRTGTGGGTILTTSSEATFHSLLAARSQAFKEYKAIDPTVERCEVNGKLVAYCSDQAHSSVEKATLIGLVKIRYIESDEENAMRGAALLKQIKKDREAGLKPFWVCVSLGTTGVCAFDNLAEVAQVCKQEGVWCHIDAAYAGAAFICPEFRVWLKGIENVNSIGFNPSKWFRTHFDCTAFWITDSMPLHEALTVNPVYLRHEYSGRAVDYTHWQIPLSKRFRALKLWFVIRNYGITGLQKMIREGVCSARKFERLVMSDTRFELPVKRHLGLVCFRLVGENHVTETLLKMINSRGKIHCVPCVVKGKYVIRFVITSPETTNEDLLDDWQEIKTCADLVLEGTPQSTRAKVPLGATRQKNEQFGTSLLLANSPMSPKIVNCSFAAIYDHCGALAEFSRTFRLLLEAQNSPAMRRRIRGILMTGKQFSLDSHMDLYHGIEPRTPCRALPPVEDRAEEDCCQQGSTLVIPSQSCLRPVVYSSTAAAAVCTKCGHISMPL